MAENLKTYNEWLSDAGKQFSPESRHFRPLYTMEALPVNQLAVTMGFRRIPGATLEEQFEPGISFLGQAGVKSFARSIAFFGYFDGQPQLRALPWTDDAVNHFALWGQVQRQSAEVRGALPPELVGGYAVQTDDGVTRAIYTGNIDHDDARMAALEAAARSLPDVEHTLIGSGTRVQIGR